MLRRIIHIALSFLLLFASTGLSLYKHYCGQELQEVSLLQAHTCCEDTELPADANDCCANETDAYRLDVDFQPANGPQLTLVAVLSPALASQLLQLMQRIQPETLLSTPFTGESGPPPLRSLSYLSQIQQFLI
jgi:hypothetical protein